MGGLEKLCNLAKVTCVVRKLGFNTGLLDKEAFIMCSMEKWNSEFSKILVNFYFLMKKTLMQDIKKTEGISFKILLRPESDLQNHLKPCPHTQIL